MLLYVVFTPDGAQLPDTENGVPIIVSRITAEIETRGLAQEGLYRLSAVKSQVEDMCARLEANPHSANLDVDVCCRVGCLVRMACCLTRCV
jgi:hypothetical protein